MGTEITRSNRLRRVLTPTEVLLGGGGTPQNVVDLSDSLLGDAQVVIYNASSFEVFWTYGTPGTPTAFSTTTGIPLKSQSYLILDAIGGACVWFASGTPQPSGSGLKIAGARV